MTRATSRSRSWSFDSVGPLATVRLVRTPEPARRDTWRSIDVGLADPARNGCSWSNVGTRSAMSEPPRRSTETETRRPRRDGCPTMGTGHGDRCALGRARHSSESGADRSLSGSLRAHAFRGHPVLGSTASRRARIHPSNPGSSGATLAPRGSSSGADGDSRTSAPAANEPRTRHRQPGAQSWSPPATLALPTPMGGHDGTRHGSSAESTSIPRGQRRGRGGAPAGRLERPGAGQAQEDVTGRERNRGSRRRSRSSRR